MKLILLLLQTTYTLGSILVLATNDTFTNQIAAFGPRLPETGTLGYLFEPAQDPTGCTKINMTLPYWIPLLKRGNCSFLTKVRNMQSSGAIAVVIGDPDNQFNCIMYSQENTSDILIPSFFIPKNEYHSLLKIIDEPMLILLQLDNYMTWSLIDTMFFIFILPSIVMTILYLSWQLRLIYIKRQQVVSPHFLSNLKSIQYYGQQETETCSICLEDYQIGEQLRLLPCRHQFHIHCVDAWLTTQKKYCPICKRDITFKV